MNGKLDKNVLEAVWIKIANNVKKQRKINGLSQLSLAINMGHKSVSLLSCIEANIANKHFNLEHLATIAVVLDISINCLFKGVDEILMVTKG